MSLNVLVYLERDGRRLQGDMTRLVSKGNELAQALGGFTIGSLIGDIGEELLAAARQLNYDEIALVSDPSLREYQPELYRSALESIFGAASPYIVLFRHSYLSAELAPTLAHRCDAPIVSNCLDVEVKASGIEIIRPFVRELCWGRVSLRGSPPYFVALQRFSLHKEAPASERSPRIKEIGFQRPAQLRVRNGGITPRGEGEDISRAEKIVAVGRGVGEKGNLKIVEGLADALGATVACSRPIADLGWLPVERQVGISGKTVHPKVYLACGISGESQHVAGMRDSSLIIAVNSDPRAPIFRVAHYGVVADLFKFLPVLTQAAVEAKERATGAEGGKESRSP